MHKKSIFCEYAVVVAFFVAVALYRIFG